MERKIIVLVAAGFLAMCLGLAVVGLVTMSGLGYLVMQGSDTLQAPGNSVSDRIADYTLPAGFGEGHGLTVAGFSMVAYTGGDGRSHIYLIQAPPQLAPERANLERRLQQATGKEEWADTSVIEQKPCEIRGQETVLLLTEGVSQDSRPYRAASGLFEGKEGPALVSISAPANHWDQEMVDTFIESLH